MHVRPLLVALALVSAVPFAVATTACGGGSASANASTTPTDTSMVIAPTPTYPTSTAPAPAPSGAVLTGTGPATPILPAAAAAVAPILNSMGQNEAPGASPEGMPFAGQFAAGQTLEQPITILPNKCYTVVGASIGITQLDIALVVQPTPMMQPMTVSQSAGAGPNPVAGGKATGCWRNPTPLTGQGKVIIRATAGQGLAAAQVFSKL
ncbi:MAG: hypothetical protein JST00_13295 [Deltaproteobacteria bacterium]|nr:hypothetical protein [Deltaproteobacteria bacterium]